MLRYIGNGFLKGVPARDLADDEVKLYGEKRLINSGLYEKPQEIRQPKRRDYTQVVEEEQDDTRD